MRNYFAYGSNMSCARLEGRVGQVICRGHAQLSGYVHSFDHRGRDGSGKGNVSLRSGETVQGVLYALSEEQVELLAPYEGGYRMILVALQLRQPESQVDAYTYTSVVSTKGLSPLDAYLEHYYRGMLENGFPEAYVAMIRQQARPTRP